MTPENYPKDRKQRDGLHPRCWECRRAARTPVIQRRTRLEKIYGITHDQYDAMLEAQGGACAICGRVSGGAFLSIDHDHGCCPGGGSCGECIRGLLCGACNRGIGYLGDDAQRLRMAIAYLESTPRGNGIAPRPEKTMKDGSAIHERRPEDLDD